MTDSDVVRRFNDAINARDLDALVALMSDDHRFVDTGGATFDGLAKAREIWRGFFASFPDYANHFERLVERAGVVAVSGHSTCSDARLAGPALWSATVRDGKVAAWRVHDDTPDVRGELGL